MVTRSVHDLLLILGDHSSKFYSDVRKGKLSRSVEEHATVFWPLPFLNPSLNPILSVLPHFSYIINPAIPTQITRVIILVILGNDGGGP